jgi:hypothetical protein
VAQVLAVVRLVAAATAEAALTPLERMWKALQTGRVAQYNLQNKRILRAPEVVEQKVGSLSHGDKGRSN